MGKIVLIILLVILGLLIYGLYIVVADFKEKEKKRKEKIKNKHDLI